MNWKKKFLKNYNIYIILDTNLLSDKKILELARVCKDRADFVQLRAKNRNIKEVYALSKKIKKILETSNTCFIINDFLSIAKDLECGLHIGKKDVELKEALRKLNKNSILGYTCHTFKEIKFCNDFNIDYISFGPVFKTPIKNLRPRGVKRLIKAIDLSIHPVFAIGGITLKNLEVLTENKIRYIVILSEFCRSERPEKFLNDLKKKLTS